MAWGMLSRLGTSLLPPVFLTLVTAASVMQIEAKASGFYSIQVIRTTDSLGPSRGVLPWYVAFMFLSSAQSAPTEMTRFPITQRL
jgi:hypothetical protein